MTMTLAAAFAEAAALWRSGRDLLLRIAAVFFFLPAFARRLFVPPPPIEGETQEALMALQLQWFGTHGHWLAAERLVEAFGACALLVLLLGEGRPTLAQALARAVRIFPAYLVAWIGGLLLIALGSLAFVLPGLYAIGRTFVIGAVVAAEPGIRPGGAIVRGLRLTTGHGWLLLLAFLSIFGLSYLALLVASVVAVGLGAGGLPEILVEAVAALVGAVVGAGMSLAVVLLQAGAYRRLAALRQGI